MFDCNSRKMSTEFCFWFLVCLIFSTSCNCTRSNIKSGQAPKKNPAKMTIRNVVKICYEWLLVEHLNMSIDQPFLELLLFTSAFVFTKIVAGQIDYRYLTTFFESWSNPRLGSSRWWCHFFWPLFVETIPSLTNIFHMGCTPTKC